MWVYLGITASPYCCSLLHLGADVECNTYTEQTALSFSALSLVGLRKNMKELSMTRVSPAGAQPDENSVTVTRHHNNDRGTQDFKAIILTTIQNDDRRKGRHQG